jgi:hypothetical protein
MDGCSKSCWNDGIQLEGYTTQRIKAKKKSVWKKWELFIFVSLLIDFSRFFFKLFGKGTVKKKGISQLDELQFRELMKGRSDEKWFEVIYCLPCSLPGLASRFERKVKKRNSEIMHGAKICQMIGIEPSMRSASRTNVMLAAWALVDQLICGWLMWFPGCRD